VIFILENEQALSKNWKAISRIFCPSREYM